MPSNSPRTAQLTRLKKQVEALREEVHHLLAKGVSLHTALLKKQDRGKMNQIAKKLVSPTSRSQKKA